MAKKRVQILSKETLIAYLLNEFPRNTNLKVTTFLDDNNCWLGKVQIEISGNPNNEDMEYFKCITRHLTD